MVLVEIGEKKGGEERGEEEIEMTITRGMVGGGEAVETQPMKTGRSGHGGFAKFSSAPASHMPSPHFMKFAR